MIKRFIVIFLLVINIFALSGCTIYSDGLIEYHTIGRTYSVHDLTDEGRKQEYIIIPAFVNGHIVSVSNGANGLHNYGNVKKVYVSYEIVDFYYNALHPDNAKVFILSNNIVADTDFFGLYVSSWLYENDYTIGKLIKRHAHIANTSFHYNYDNSPNEGYYWIDDYDYGQLITFIPPNPTREGYTFEGWFKEPECINQWDFTKNLTYNVEESPVTNLYAKWV